MIHLEVGTSDDQIVIRLPDAADQGENAVVERHDSYGLGRR